MSTAKKTTRKATAKKAVKKAATKKAAKTATAKTATAKTATAKTAAKAPTPSSKKAAHRAAQKAAAKKVQAPAPKPAKPARAPAEPPVGDKYAILKPDYRRQPDKTAINRLGGLPIGIDAATWPRRDGAPMYHVLTIDLKDHPAIVPQRFRALALFISHPSKHEAYESGNRHTRVVLLKEADLAKGVPAWPDGLDKKDALRAGTLRIESAAELTRKKLYQHSYAGDEPIWLQGDEDEYDFEFDEDDIDTDSDDDDDDDDDDSGDESDSVDVNDLVPHIFVLQFDERLIPGINLGDMGIMYVFSDDAWFQCH